MSNRRLKPGGIQGSVRILLIGLALATSGATVAVAGTAPPFVTQADIPAVLDVPNATYILRESVISTSSNPAITISAPGVKFYLSGNTIDGLGTGYYGIDVTGVSNVRIVGPGTVRNFRRCGVALLSGTTRSTIQGLTVTGNGFGSEQEAIVLFGGANYNSVVGNNSSYNGGEGIELHRNANWNNIVNNTCNGNDFGGILIGLHGSGTSVGNTLSGNTTNGNLYEGIYLTDRADQNQVIRNTAIGNSGGIVVDNGSTQNRLLWNRASGNTAPFYDLYEGNPVWAPVNFWLWNTGNRNGPGAANIN